MLTWSPSIPTTQPMATAATIEVRSYSQHDVQLVIDAMRSHPDHLGVQEQGIALLWDEL